jgi:hypothetical protein
MNRRKFGSITTAGFAALVAASVSANEKAVDKNRDCIVLRAVAFECTFLKAKEGQREKMARFIRANWFAMDEVAVKQGIMTSYRLFEANDSNPDWDLMMFVAYPKAGGYSAIQRDFEVIRAAHKPVQIDGMGLRDMGSIVKSHRFTDVSDA